MYPFDLALVTIVLGLFYVASHGFALMRSDLVQDWLKALPRNYTVGVVLMGLSALWFGWMLATQDLMDYTKYRQLFIIIMLVGVGLVIYFLKEFLAARALGCFALLVGGMLLEVGFMRPEITRWIISLTAYVYIFMAMFWIGAPYLLRDQILWVCGNERVFKTLAGLGVLFGILLLGLGIFVF